MKKLLTIWINEDEASLTCAVGDEKFILEVSPLHMDDIWEQMKAICYGYA